MTTIKNFDENIMGMVIANNEHNKVAIDTINRYYRTDYNFNAYYALFVTLLADEKLMNSGEERMDIIEDVLQEHDENYTKHDVEYLTEIMTDYRIGLCKVYKEYEDKYWDEQAKEKAEFDRDMNNWCRFNCVE